MEEKKRGRWDEGGGRRRRNNTAVAADVNLPQVKTR